MEKLRVKTKLFTVFPIRYEGVGSVTLNTKCIEVYNF
jgi:hypothetical protein